MDQFSYYEAPIKNTHPLKAVTLPEVHSLILSDRFKELTELLRSKTTKAERNNIKTLRLDYVTFSGVFTERADIRLIRRSGLLSIDIDSLNPDSLKVLKVELLKGLTPALLFVSPSGEGIKAVYRIDPGQGSHIDYFSALRSYFQSEFTLSIDEHCKDVARACFLCYDPECSMPEAPVILDGDFIEQYREPLPTVTRTAATDSPVISEPLTDSEQALTIENITTWALNTFEFSEGNRNKFITELGGAFNRAGVSPGAALGALLTYTEPGFTEAEIKTTFRSIYARKDLHGIAPLNGSAANDFKDLAGVTPLLSIEGFPEPIQGLIKTCSEIYGTHRDLWTAAILGATASALGQAVSLVDGKYKNAPLLWLTVVGSSGVGKSEPFKFAYEPLDSADLQRYKDYKRACEFTPESAKGKQPKPLQPEQAIIKDSTPEAMAKAMGARQKGISIVRDELNGFFKDFDRYSRSGEQENLLSIWSQQPFKVNRVSGDSIFIKDPFVNIIGGIQPGVIPDMGKDGRTVNGFLSRFCFVYPDKLNAPDYNYSSLAPELVSHYREYINELLTLPDYTPVFLDFDSEEIYRDFYNKNAALNNSGKQPDYMNEVNSKLNIIALRVALVLHCSRWPFTGNADQYINPDTMQQAVNIGEYFRITAKKVYGLLGSDRADKKEVIKYLSSLGNSQNDIAKVLKVKQPYVNRILKQ
ncbi:MAG: hypothetical protein FD166_2836 [Bacteroidetes bacterium]|nr:MAG: hypothetical protein FD166_2836 [Bacteroidota bacterium]